MYCKEKENNRGGSLHDSELIFAQLQNFCQVPAIVEWVNSVLKKNLSVQRNVRMEDAGSIVISGFTAGLRARPSFDWARNFLNPSRHPQSKQEAMRYEAASVFAMFWNMVQKVCPSVVIDNFKRFMEQTGLISMDPKEFSEQGGSGYTVNYKGSNITFKGVDMAPPSGVFMQNYARHGLQCCASSNAFTLWDPSLPHRTSLQSISPNAEEIVQSGLSIVTGERLPGTFKRYQQNQLTAEQLARNAAKLFALLLRWMSPLHLCLVLLLLSQAEVPSKGGLASIRGNLLALKAPKHLFSSLRLVAPQLLPK
ncbi:hypothetical protein F5890DRAFT_1477873 [Lentinula detonsa]|uniref:Uncharacterized protein n=1 Tax=Lentinula detonsa TaxID=2804962 RepID=A0AA38PRC6_9AGAR|nr:hypothetical protein F5890DRAFT_1477873 [Lentinula detonsa]